MDKNIRYSFVCNSEKLEKKFNFYLCEKDK